VATKLVKEKTEFNEEPYSKVGKRKNFTDSLKHDLNTVQTAKPINLDETDRKILQLLQDDFPIAEKPWKEIGDKLRISEAEVITRLKRLREGGIIQKVGPILDSSKIGLNAATLVAMKVPEDKIDAVASVINGYNSVSHNYERENEYNIWFTITASDTEELTAILDEITEKTGIEQSRILNLPTTQRFKINVRFQLA
jgi:DNA-binding Lrp family transcriptional regulator